MRARPCAAGVAVASALSVAVLAAAFFAAARAPRARAEDRIARPTVSLLDPREVRWSGPWASALDLGVRRIAAEPFTADWLLADVSFGMERIFTNYSGDASGRFIELAALTSAPGARSPAALGPVLERIASFQKPDGHFGAAIDLKKPLAKGSPPIPLLWGNARLLVGLVTAAGAYHDDALLAAARRLGDFYVSTAGDLCSRERIADYRSSGTYGDGYTCCYFPAIEGLALLHRATGEQRYLDQALRMAELFVSGFDALPIEHSHGNLCAWRGVLELYAITGDRTWLDRARSKWEAAVSGGYVWTLGGIGEHWMPFWEGDEGCSESDWLRFTLDLWRHTGEARFLDMAERLLENQYPANQTANGGYGTRHFDGGPEGPAATRGSVDEWPFCCSFHGPLGLHFLKAYLASGSSEGVSVNFLADFSGRLGARGGVWKIESRRSGTRDAAVLEIALQSATGGDPAPVPLSVRAPWWARAARLESPGGPRALESRDGWVRVGELASGGKARLVMEGGMRIEDRRFHAVRVEPGRAARLRDVVVLRGPQVLACNPSPASGRPVILATVDARGEISLPGRAGDAPVTVAVPAGEEVRDPAALLSSAQVVVLRPLAETRSRRRTAFAVDIAVVPEASLPASGREGFAERAIAAAAGPAAAGPFFGNDLERNPQAWIGASGWTFGPEGIRVSGGDLGLIDGEGYGDYSFEFELVLPADGQGIAGWVVRAASETDCLMFQVQAADSTFDHPEWRTRPGTLRPHARKGGTWTMAEPALLSRAPRRGETHRVATECRGDRIDVLIDGERVYTGSAAGILAGGVGFRAAGPAEAGLFRKVSLKRL